MRFLHGAGIASFALLLLCRSPNHSQPKTRKSSGIVTACRTFMPPDRESMFYAHGWAQMRNQADLLLRLYGESRGRAAEYWGGEPKLELDRWVQLNGVPDRARQLVRRSGSAVPEIPRRVRPWHQRLCRQESCCRWPGSTVSCCRCRVSTSCSILCAPFTTATWVRPRG